MTARWEGIVAGGWDPSIAEAGLVMVTFPHPQRLVVLHHETVKSTTKDGDLVTRLEIHRRAIAQSIIKFRPSVFFVERQQGPQVNAFREGQKTSNNDKTLIVYGAAISAALSLGIRVVEITPQKAEAAMFPGGKRVKRTRAQKKKKMTEMACALTGLKLTEHEAEALACTVAGLRTATRKDLQLTRAA